MISKNFAHDICSTVNKKPNHFAWDFNSKNSNISFYIDSDVIRGINDKNDGKIKFLWTLESQFYNGGVVQFIKNNLNQVLETYELIFTYDDELVDLHPKFKWVPAMGSWIKTPTVYKKNKLVSMITSSKSHTPQQIFRKNFAQRNVYNLDLFGRGFKEIENKEDGLCDYMFSVCIENDIRQTYFTEKLLDCFATGTIPIYSGTKNVIKYFDGDGIIFLDDLSLDNLSPEMYDEKLRNVLNNFENVMEFLCPEDYIYKNYIKNYL